VLAAETMTTNRKTLILRFVPGIDATFVMQPGLNLRGIVDEKRKRRNAVFPIVLKLIVAPDNAKIRSKLIESAARRAKAVDHRLAMLVGMRLPFIRSPLRSHRLGPIIDRP
jgi:hypothetical protein